MTRAYRRPLRSRGHALTYRRVNLSAATQAATLAYDPSWQACTFSIALVHVTGDVTTDGGIVGLRAWSPKRFRAWEPWMQGRNQAVFVSTLPGNGCNDCNGCNGRNRSRYQGRNQATLSAPRSTLIIQSLVTCGDTIR